MKKTSKVKGALEVLVVIGLILVIPLFFAIKTAADRQEAKNTPVPPAPTASEVPEASFVTTAQQPPQCTFPLAQTTTAESTPEEYTFSEPQVALTDERQPDIIEWLPDNRNVLIMPSKFIDLGMNGVVPVVELGEVSRGSGLVREPARKGGMGLNDTEVGLDARVIVGLARAAEKLGDAELLEILARGVSAHLGAPIAE